MTARQIHAHQQPSLRHGEAILKTSRGVRATIREAQKVAAWKTSRQHPGLGRPRQAAGPTPSRPARRVSKKVSAAIDKMVSGECKNITEARSRRARP